MSIARAILIGTSSFILGCSPLIGQAPTVQSIVNVSTFDQRFCPGVVASVNGANFGQTISNVTVLVDGRKAAIVNYQLPSQLDFQIPIEVALGPARVQVQTAMGATPEVTINLSQYAPTLPTRNYSFRHVDPSATNVSNMNPALPGQQIVAYAYGLGPTIPPWTPGAYPNPPSTTVAPVTLTVGGEPVPVSFAGASYDLWRYGLYAINFTVPSDLPSGLYPVVATVGGQSSNSSNLILSQRLPTIASVDNGASFLPKGITAAGSVLTIRGTGFGSSDKLGIFPSTQANGISVTIGGIRAPIFDLVPSASQLNVLAPFELAEFGTVPVVVTNSFGPSASFPVRLAFAVPALFRINDPSHTSRYNAVAVKSNTAWIAMPVSMAIAIGLPARCSGLDPASYCGEPARQGDYIQIYATGLGTATADGTPQGQRLATGEIAPADGSTIYGRVYTPTVTIGGAPAAVIFSGVAPGYAGLYQINVQIPDSAPDGDDVPITVSILGSASDSATIALKR